MDLEVARSFVLRFRFLFSGRVETDPRRLSDVVDDCSGRGDADIDGGRGYSCVFGKLGQSGEEPMDWLGLKSLN